MTKQITVVKFNLIRAQKCATSSSTPLDLMMIAVKK